MITDPEMASSPTPSPVTITPELTAAADAVIRRHTLYGVACGFIPMPVVDMVAVAGVEVKMISELASVYGCRFPEELVFGKVIIALVGSIGPLYVYDKIQGAIGRLPGIGVLAGPAFLAAANAASVYVVGKVFQKHFESGETFLSGDNELIQEFMGEKYREARRLDWIAPGA